MIRGRILWPALAFVAVIAACSSQDSADYADEATEAATEAVAAVLDAEAATAVIAGIEVAFISAYNAGDAEGIAVLFAPDGTSAQPLAPTTERADIAAVYGEQFAAGGTRTLEVMREDFIVGDGWMTVWGGWVVTATPEGAETIEMNGRYGSVYRQQEDGTWKIYRHLFNYTVPPPGFGEDM